MDLSIIIVSWNTRELLRKCLASIFANAENLNLEVIVVDNNSADASSQMVAQDFPQVSLISNTTNAGYVAGNNQGIALSTGEFILLLNPDTEILPQTFSSILNFMSQRPKVGIAGCRLLNADKTQQLSVRRFPHLLDQLIILTKVHNFFPSLVKRYLWLDFNYDQEQEVDQVMGAFMLVRRAVINQIGDLDKNIWSWFEDVDFCYRAKAAGWQVVYTPISQIIHHKGQSFAQKLPFDKHVNFVNSLLYYFKKNYGTLAYLILLPFAFLSLLLAYGVQLFGIKKINKQL